MVSITIRAAFDPEAGAWYIADSTLPGLHIEADTAQELYDKLPGAIADLLEGQPGEVPFELIMPGRAVA